MNEFSTYETIFKDLAVALKGQRGCAYKDLDGNVTIAVINNYTDNNDNFIGSIIKDVHGQCEYLSLLYNTLPPSKPLAEPYTEAEIEGPTHPLLHHYLTVISSEFLSTDSLADITNEQSLWEFLRKDPTAA